MLSRLVLTALGPDSPSSLKVQNSPCASPQDFIGTFSYWALQPSLREFSAFLLLTVGALDANRSLLNS